MERNPRYSAQETLGGLQSRSGLGVFETSKSHCFVGNRSLARPGHCLVTSPTELPPDGVQRRAVLRVAVMLQIFRLAVSCSCHCSRRSAPCSCPRATRRRNVGHRPDSRQGCYMRYCRQHSLSRMCDITFLVSEVTSTVLGLCSCDSVVK